MAANNIRFIGRLTRASIVSNYYNPMETSGLSRATRISGQARKVHQAVLITGCRPRYNLCPAGVATITISILHAAKSGFEGDGVYYLALDWVFLRLFAAVNLVIGY